MKFTKKQRVLKRFYRVSKIGKFISKHISKRIGRAIREWNRDILDKHYYGTL